MENKNLLPRVPASLWMILSVGLFSINHALVKLVASDYSAPSIVFYRSVFSLGFLFLFLGPRNFMSSFKTKNLKIQVLRGAFSFLFLYLTIVSLRGTTLTAFTTLFYTSPIITVLVSSFFLNERWKENVLASAVLCFFGVVLMFFPQGEVDALYGAAALLCALCHTAVLLLSKSASNKNDSPKTLILYYIAFSAFFSGIFVEKAVPCTNLLWSSIVLGAIHLVGFYCFTKAIEKEDLSSLVTYEYSSFIWAPILGFLFYNEVPTIQILCAVLLILSGCLLVSKTKNLKS